MSLLLVFLFSNKPANRQIFVNLIKAQIYHITILEILVCCCKPPNTEYVCNTGFPSKYEALNLQDRKF